MILSDIRGTNVSPSQGTSSTLEGRGVLLFFSFVADPISLPFFGLSSAGLNPARSPVVLGVAQERECGLEAGPHAIRPSRPGVF